MKRILCYGDSNVWGFIPGSFNSETKLAKRHARSNRWTTVLQNKLGNNYEVISDGINERTTDLHEINPGRSFRNGLTYLEYSIEIHYPIHLIICPPPIKENSHPEFNYEAVIKSNKLAKVFYELASEMQCEFLDAGTYIESSLIDGIHLDSEFCFTIGNKIFEKIALMQI